MPKHKNTAHRNSKSHLAPIHNYRKSRQPRARKSAEKAPRRHDSCNATVWSANGFPVPRNCLVKNLQTVTFIMGGTLDRYRYSPDVQADIGPNIKFFLVYPLPDTDQQALLRLRGGCDACPYIHKPTHLGCSANQPNGCTPMTEPGVLYDFVSKKPVTSKFLQVNEEEHPTGKIRGVTLRFFSIVKAIAAESPVVDK